MISGQLRTATILIWLVGTLPQLALAGPFGPDFSDLIPPSRRIDWRDAGVPGGIRSDRAKCVTAACQALENAALDYKNGTLDAQPLLQAAIDSALNDTYVFIPAGDYLMSAGVRIVPPYGPAVVGKGITLRGAGPDKTRLLPSGGGAVLGIGAFGWLPQAGKALGTITGGSNKGSRRIQLSSTSDLAVGMFIRIDQDNDTELVWSTGNYQRLMGQVAMITAVDSSSIEINVPLYYDFTRNPQIVYLAGVGRFSGIEDLTIDHSVKGSNAFASIYLDGVYGCWVKNVQSIKAAYHILAETALNCEIRDSYIKDSRAYGANTGGIVMGNVGASKIENNIFYKTFPGIEVNGSASGNFFGYNFGSTVEAGWEYSGCMFNGNHGPHNIMNLWEGNVGEMFQIDGYHGSGSHGTAFRNYFTAYSPTKQGNFKAISLNRWSYYYNLIGNVLGSPAWLTALAGTTKYYQPEIVHGYNNPVIYQFGFPNMGNNGFSGVYDGIQPQSAHDPQNLDLRVKRTTMRWGNYDYLNQQTKWDPSEIPQDVPVPTTQALPKSLYYDRTPAWWSDTTIPWPPIGPDVAGRTNPILAQKCFETLALATGGVFDPKRCYPPPLPPTQPAAPSQLRVQ